MVGSIIAASHVTPIIDDDMTEHIEDHRTMEIFTITLTLESKSEPFNVPLFNDDGTNDTHKVKDGH